MSIRSSYFYAQKPFYPSTPFIQGKGQNPESLICPYGICFPPSLPCLFFLLSPPGSLCSVNTVASLVILKHVSIIHSSRILPFLCQLFEMIFSQIISACLAPSLCSNCTLTPPCPIAFPILVSCLMFFFLVFITVWYTVYVVYSLFIVVVSLLWRQHKLH